MNSSPSPGDSELRLAPREEPLSRPSPSAPPEESATDAPRPVDASTADVPERGRFSFIVSMLLVALTFCVGLSYFMEKRWPRAVETNSVPANGTALTVVAAAPGPLGPDTFRISAVSLSPPRMAIVNGRQVSEGETFPVQTDRGIINVTVKRIGDGTVSLMVGGQVIEAPIHRAGGLKN